MKQIAYKIIFIIAIIVLVFLVGVNLYVNEDFLKASFIQCLPLIFTLCIAFWATQYKNDFRKHKDHAERIVFKLQDIVTNERFYTFKNGQKKQNEERTKEVTTNNRKIKNYINILNQYSKQLKIDDDVKYIKEEFTKYETLIGDHISDVDYLSKSQKELQKYSENIDSKCEFIILKLYK